MGRASSMNGKKKKKKKKKKKNAYTILIGKPQRRRPLGLPIRKWVDNIKMDIR
jgi:hypothetical protein